MSRWSPGNARRSVAQEVEHLAGELRGLERLEEAVAALISGEGLPPGLEPEALFEGGVPRIRPVLVVLASRAAAERDAEPATAFEVAAVAEMLHAAVFLHDAALGRQDGRRRRVARRVLRKVGWLGANHLTLRALELARRAPQPEILGEALDTLRVIAEGHALDEQLRARPATPPDALLHAEGRSGALFSFACRAGGHVARAGRPAVTGLGRYGRHVGIAWHLAEDLSLFERPARDLARAAARPSYPVAYANARDPDVDALWRRLGEGWDPALADEVVARVRGAGGLAAGREALVKETWSARRALAPLRPSPARDSLDRLAASLAAVPA
jgi:geranylgeranyl pyrophosphate synthase